jgi:hypothetical protein
VRVLGLAAIAALVRGDRTVVGASDFSDRELVVAGHVGCSTLNDFAEVGVEDMRLAVEEARTSLEQGGNVTTSVFPTLMSWAIDEFCP